MTKKRCSQCHKKKDYDEFPKDKSQTDGLRSACKVCRNSKRRTKYNEPVEEFFKIKNYDYVLSSFSYSALHCPAPREQVFMMSFSWNS